MRPLTGLAQVRVLACALALICSSCSAGMSPDLAEQFRAGEAAFDQAKSPSDYLRAAGLYQQILDAGCESGAVLYNQGNAYVRAGKIGNAIACYRRAKRYMPRDPNLDWNLRYATQQAPSSPAKPILEHLLFWQDWLSYAEKFHITGLFASMTLLFALLGLATQYRRLGNRLALAGLVLTMVLAASAAYDWYRFDYIPRGVIAQKDVVARKGNAESYEQAFTEPLVEGTEFRILEQRGEWIEIQLGEGQRGWVRESSVARI